MTTAIHLELLRLPEVLKCRGISRSLHLNDVAAGRYTPPVKIGRCVLWPRHEIDALLAAQINRATPEQLRTLSTELVEQRKALMPASMQREKVQ